MVATANPQKEDGYTAVANELLEALAAASLNGTQFRLMLLIIRKTYGWQQKRDTIGLAQFCALTGLSKPLVSRELNRLARRGFIVVTGDDHHAKGYGVQKDHSRWRDNVPGDALTGDAPARVLPFRRPPAPPPVAPAAPEVFTDRITPEVLSDQITPGPGCSPIGQQSVIRSDKKVLSDRITTKEKKETKGLPDSHESGGAAPPIPVGTLRERYDARYREAANKVGVLGDAFRECLGAKPDHGRLGALMRDVGSGAKLLDLILEASRQRIGDDPHDYLAALVRRERSGGGGRGYVSQADLNSGSHRRFVGA